MPMTDQKLHFRHDDDKRRARLLAIVAILDAGLFESVAELTEFVHDELTPEGLGGGIDWLDGYRSGRNA